MTKEEAKEIIESECYVFNPLNLDMTTRINTALDMAIKALEQEPILDKIRAEINAMCGDIETIADVLAIIDKYKVETEGEVCKGCHYNDGEVHAECVLCDKAGNEERNEM